MVPVTKCYISDSYYCSFLDSKADLIFTFSYILNQYSSTELFAAYIHTPHTSYKHCIYFMFLSCLKAKHLLLKQHCEYHLRIKAIWNDL